MSKYIGNTVQYKNNQNNKTFSESSTRKRDKIRSISTTSCSSTPTTSPSSSCSSTVPSETVSNDIKKSKSENKDSNQSCPYFIPFINPKPLDSRVSVEPFCEPFRQIQLTPCDEGSTNDANQLVIRTDLLDDNQVLLSKTIYAEVHPEPSSSKPLKTKLKIKSSSSKSNSSSSSSPSSSQSIISSRPIVVDSLPNFSPLLKSTCNLNSGNNKESKMTIYNILSNSNHNQTKLNGITTNGSLPNGLSKNVLPLMSRSQPLKKMESNLSEIRLDMEMIAETEKSKSAKDDQLDSTNEDKLITDSKLDSAFANENASKPDTYASEKDSAKTPSIKNTDQNNLPNPNDKIKSLLKTVSSDKKVALERRLSGSFPCPETPDTNESSAPSPGWATKILNPDLRFQNTNTHRPMLNQSQRYSTISSSRAPSIISGYSVYDVQIPHERLTDLRKILNPEVEKKDLETVFKAHWETFMDCRCFECTFNNAAKLITVAVLAFTFFLFTRALANIFRR